MSFLIKVKMSFPSSSNHIFAECIESFLMFPNRLPADITTCAEILDVSALH